VCHIIGSSLGIVSGQTRTLIDTFVYAGASPEQITYTKTVTIPQGTGSVEIAYDVFFTSVCPFHDCGAAFTLAIGGPGLPGGGISDARTIGTCYGPCPSTVKVTFDVSAVTANGPVFWTIFGTAVGTDTEVASVSIDGTITAISRPLTVTGSITNGPTASKQISQNTANATFPLGSEFTLKLQAPDASGVLQPIGSAFSLSSASVSPAIATPTLFPNNVVIEFDQGSPSASKVFRAVHLGTVTVTITPSDQSISPVTVNLTINMPSRLGNAPTTYDTTLISLGHQRGIPPSFLKADVAQESGSTFNPNAFRYELLSMDLADISGGRNWRTVVPFSLYRLATSDGLTRGANLTKADIDPREILFGIPENATYVSASQLYAAFNSTQRWYVLTNRSTQKLIDKNPNVLNFTAQTTLASSYGLLQMLYRTAVLDMGWKGSPSGQPAPHLLFDPNTALPLGSDFLRRCFEIVNPGQGTTFASPFAFSESFRKAFNQYNHASIYDVQNYGPSVLSKVANYLPAPQGPIFP